MTSSKDLSRPTSQHRLSVGSNASSLPSRTAYSRSHSHTISHGSSTNANRINRRKSSTFSPMANAAVIGAAVENGSLPVNRRSSMSKAALATLNDTPIPTIPSSLPHHVSVPEDESESAIIDGPALSSFQGIDKIKKMRRASDGTRLSKKEKAGTGDLKCEHCGKAYKHGSCLNKHLWEHTPQWQLTSKLLISKHQQVQLLEAASVLIQMNGDGTGPNDSDNSSSPAASGSSERDEDLSSAETTPPPQADPYRDSKRFSNTSSAYSRSYQSVFSESAPNLDHGFSHHRQWSSSSNRPHTAHTSIAESYQDDDQQDLSAAVALLSCSYGTPKSGPTGMPSDVPPVPPLPEKYANAFSNYAKYDGQDDVMMDDDDESSDDDPAPRTAHDDYENSLIFGKMDS